MDSKPTKLNENSFSKFYQSQRINNILENEDNELYSQKSHTKLPTNFIQLVKNALKQNKTPIILLNTGSYCPGHYGHISLFTKVKKYLEANFDITVIAGYISPSNDSYILNKSQRCNFQDFLIDIDTRINLLRTTIDSLKLDFDLIVSKWEAAQPGYFGFTQVWAAYQYYFDTILAKEDKSLVGSVQVSYCIGDDMLKTTVDTRHKSLKVSDQIQYHLPLTIISRDNADHSESIQEKIKLYSSYTKEKMQSEKIYYIREKNEEGQNFVSSTYIRQHYKSKDGEKMLEGVMPAKVVQMLREYFSDDKEEQGKESQSSSDSKQ